LNQRPLAPHASALPGCATPRPERLMIPSPVCIVTVNPKETRLLRSTEVVLQPLDVVFPEIRSLLDLDDDQVLPPDVFDPVDGPLGYVEGVPRRQPNFLPVQRHDSLPPNEVPMFGSMPVPLQAQAFPRAHEELLDLAPFLLVEDEVEAPWTISPFPVPGGAAVVGMPGRIHERVSAKGVPGEA
jgi:hypothetical protein